jgi:hypothetical protein
MIHHFDRGILYASSDYIGLLEQAETGSAGAGAAIHTATHAQSAFCTCQELQGYIIREYPG